jgi:hypothetical protein
VTDDKTADGPAARLNQSPYDLAQGAPLALPHTAWLRNLLTVSGPAAEVARFCAAARGTGGIAWHLDPDHEETRLLAPMATEGPEARMLARELREVVASLHDRVVIDCGQAGFCPLDLNRLIPIPEEMLLLGETAPAAQRWLWARWGTTRPLHQVRIRADRADRRLRRTGRVVYEFLAADWTPWPAVEQLCRDWPRLRITIRPCYDEGADDA